MNKHEAYTTVLTEMERLLIHINENPSQKDVFFEGVVGEFLNISCPAECKSDRERFNLRCEELKRK